MHVVLLGDSIFDNAVYVPGEPAVIEQLRDRLPGDWEVTLLAVDGHITADIANQLEKQPKDATHLVVSSGGNDALAYLPVLQESARSVTEVLARFSRIRNDFAAAYRTMLARVVATRYPVTVCTIYDAVPALDAAARAALSMFNEVILREAFAAKVTVIDLRLVCAEAADYSAISAIEPSAIGGARVAEWIAGVVTGGGQTDAVSVVVP